MPTNLSFKMPTVSDLNKAAAIKSVRASSQSTLDAPSRPYRFSEGGDFLFLSLPKDIAEGTPQHRVLQAFRTAEKSIQAMRTARRQIDVKNNTEKKRPTKVSAEYALEVAANHVEPLLKSRSALAQEKRALQKRKEGWTLDKPDPAGEEERREIRSMLRGMNPQDRNNFIQRNGSAKSIMDAVVSAMPEMSGVDHEIHAGAKHRLLRDKYAKDMDEVEQIEKAIAQTEKALELAKTQALTAVNGQAVLGIVEDISAGVDPSLRRISRQMNGGLNSFEFDDYYETLQHANPKKLERLRKLIDGSGEETEAA